MWGKLRTSREAGSMFYRNEPQVSMQHAALLGQSIQHGLASRLALLCLVGAWGLWLEAVPGGSTLCFYYEP